MNDPRGPSEHPPVFPILYINDSTPTHSRPVQPVSGFWHLGNRSKPKSCTPIPTKRLGAEG
jgi:hypothetical protein